MEEKRLSLVQRGLSLASTKKSERMQECEPLSQRKDERGVFKVACAHVSFLAAGSPLRFLFAYLLIVVVAVVGANLFINCCIFVVILTLVGGKKRAWTSKNRGTILNEAFSLSFKVLLGGGGRKEKDEWKNVMNRYP